MSQRFFVESPIGDASTARLTGDEAQHLAKVMRAKPGDEIIAFDGSGWEFVARVAAISKAAVDLEIVARAEVNRELPPALTMAVALPKGDRQKVLVEKLVELGVTRLIPLETSRSVAEATPGALVRLRRQVIEASKQCGRNRLMAIAEPKSLAELVSKSTDDQRRILAHPGGRPLSLTSAGAAIVAVGPEGGFQEDEVRAAVAAHWEIVSLGPRILRIETAAIALAAAFSQT
jgi:16S rRNA (uracil1498-N3)-methyltransferase